MIKAKQTLRYQADIYGDNYFYLIPTAEREDGVIERNWASHIDAAVIALSLKASRMTDIQRRFNRHVDLKTIVRMVALNPTPVEHPAGYYIDQVKTSSIGLQALGFTDPVRAHFALGLKYPEYVGMTGTAQGELFMAISNVARDNDIDLADIRAHLGYNQAFLKVAMSVGAYGIEELQRKFAQKTDQSPAQAWKDFIRKPDPEHVEEFARIAKGVYGRTLGMPAR